MVLIHSILRIFHKYFKAIFVPFMFKRKIIWFLSLGIMISFIYIKHQIGTFDCFCLILIYSKLHCLHFSSWDSSKEWIVDMPQNEDIEAICLGLGWAAAATSALLLRLFTIGGVQKEVFSLPGPVVSMAGHGEQLFIVYHRGRFFF